MRIRTIKPEFWESESLGRVSREARLLFIGLFSCCDDSGRTRASSRLLASRLYPYDEDAGRLLEGWLKELEAQGCIRRYAVDGDQYLDIPKWLNHQKIDKPSNSKLPEFAEGSPKPREDSRKIALEQGTGNREQGEEQGTGNGVPPAVPAKRFKPPTREELDLEAAKVGLPANEVDAFVGYYGANGWRVGRNPMRSWKYALSGWAARWRERGPSLHLANGRRAPLPATPDNAGF